MLAIIGGSGLSRLSSLVLNTSEVVDTPYGAPSGPLIFGELAGRSVVFLARHGEGHTIPPHQINYRANVWALKQAKVTEMVSIATVGGIRAEFSPGKLVIPDQIIDYTWGRISTFFEVGSDQPVHHIDFTHPFDQALRNRILFAADGCGESVFDGGVYATTQGPRLETAAEINRMERDGADLVGMTGMPEAALAREQQIAYAAINVIANHAAGRGDSEHKIEFEQIEQVLREAMIRVGKILEKLCQG